MDRSRFFWLKSNGDIVEIDHERYVGLAGCHKLVRVDGGGANFLLAHNGDCVWCSVCEMNNLLHELNKKFE